MIIRVLPNVDDVWSDSEKTRELLDTELLGRMDQTLDDVDQLLAEYEQSPAVQDDEASIEDGPMGTIGLLMHCFHRFRGTR